MREIKIKGRKYCENIDLVGKVDESTIDFIGDTALVEAKVCEKIMDKEIFRYKCWGLIDKDFNSVVFPSGAASDLLSFGGYSKEAFRVGEEDFLIAVDRGNEYCSHRSWLHMKMIDGIPTVVVEDMGYIKRTDVEHLIISGGAVYDIKKGKHVTSRHNSIEVYPPNSDGEILFLIGDAVTVSKRPDGKPLKEKVTDVLSFFKDENNEIVSGIYSMQMNESYVLDGQEYNEFLGNHRTTLSGRAMEAESKKNHTLLMRPISTIKPNGRK